MFAFIFVCTVCAILPTDPNGVFNWDAPDDSVGSTVTLTCNNGFTTTADVVKRSCDLDATGTPIWTDPVEECQPVGKKDHFYCISFF